MPVIESCFRPPWYLSNCHVQTILPGPRRCQANTGFPAGNGWSCRTGIFWIWTGWNPGAGGLPSSAPDSRETERSGHAPSGRKFSVQRMGCPGLELPRLQRRARHRLQRSYHSGATEDLATVVAHAGQRQIALVGFSIGGNLVLKFLGESPPPATVLAAAAVSAPIDLAATARALDGRPGNRIYLRRLIASLCAKVREKSAAMPDLLSAEGLDRLHGFEHFDERYTAPTHGFLSAEDYWKKCSARQFLAGIRVPTLLVSAKDDPFLTPESFPFPEAQANPNLTLEVPDSGGHLGFLDGEGFWLGRRLPGFLSGFVP